MTDLLVETPAEPPASAITLEWLRPVRVFALGLKVYILKILTLGIYHFWGKTEVRRKIWSAVHIDGQPVEYTGRGKELFLGFLIAFLVVILPIFLAFQALPYVAIYLIKIMPGWGMGAMLAVTFVGQLFLFLIIYYFIGVARYRARRYRLSRSRWRGIRGTMVGSSWQYGWIYLWTGVAMFATLGWLLPWRNVKLQRRLTNETRFGEEPLHFKGGAWPLFKSYVLMWIGGLVVLLGANLLIYLLYGEQIQAFYKTMQRLSVPRMTPEILSPSMIGHIYLIYIIAGLLMALVGAWYMSRQFNHFAASTHIDKASFSLKTTPHGLIWLVLGNMLITIGVVLLALIVLGGLAALIVYVADGVSLWQQVQSQRQLMPGAPPNLSGGSPFLLILPLLAIMMLLSSGIAGPLVAVRSVRHFVSRMGIEGSIDFDRIVQSQQHLDRTGEGLAEAFEIDGF